MNSRRYFFRQLASGLVAASSPGLFLPKLIKPGWKAPRPRYQACEFTCYEIRKPEKFQLDGMELSAAAWLAAYGERFWKTAPK